MKNMVDRKVSNRKIWKHQLSNAKKILLWNQMWYSAFGVNPDNFNYTLNKFVHLYMIGQFISTALDIDANLSNTTIAINMVIRFMAIAVIFGRFAFFKLKRQDLACIQEEISSDFAVENFENELELQIFIKYVTIAKTSIKYIIPFIFFSSIIYYFRNLYTIDIHSDPESLDWKTFFLSYRLSLDNLVEGYKKYLGIYIFGLLMAPLSGFVFSSDCGMLMTFVMHICGQLSVLSQCMVKNLADDTDNFQRKLKHIVQKHNRLKRIAKMIDSTYSYILLQVMMTISIFICIICYNILTHWNYEKKVLITHLMSYTTTSCILFTYCYAGQCLINESWNLSNALYNIAWYKLNPKQMKYYIILIEQTQKPLVLTAGGLYVFSNRMIIDVCRTGLAYLSVLRRVNDSVSDIHSVVTKNTNNFLS